MLAVCGEKVEFLKNGDVKVGCTTVESAVFEQIINARKEKMGG
jgi:hypothetical protein